MDSHDIKQLVEAKLPDCKVTLTGDGTHFDMMVVSVLFDKKRLLERHQMIYDAVGSSINSGQLHALSMKTLTPKEWDALHG